VLVVVRGVAVAVAVAVAEVEPVVEVPESTAAMSVVDATATAVVEVDPLFVAAATPPNPPTPRIPANAVPIVMARSRRTPRSRSALVMRFAVFMGAPYGSAPFEPMTERHAGRAVLRR
jgi:hypothetical protein